jgi:thioredoxin reductase (NADPH)
VGDVSAGFRLAAGDVRHGSTKRVAGAVGEGAVAAALIFRRLAELGVTVSPG